MGRVWVGGEMEGRIVFWPAPVGGVIRGESKSDKFNY